MKKYPKISLVGAGPGDAELITVKGLKALQSANVVMYDALSNPALLAEAPIDSIKINVGKRADNHAYPQEEINLMMVQQAYLHGHVVRLKGGDPFIFGRGHEELQFADAFGIETQVIPGISSCYAVAELQQVPLTRRGVSESFWVITGTTTSGEISNDIELAAKSTATVVILMGLKKLPEIAQLFQAQGKGEMSVMIVQNGSLSNEKMVLGTIDTIVTQVKENGIGAPAIIVIGNVVDLHPENGERRTANGERQKVKNGFLGIIENLLIS